MHFLIPAGVLLLTLSEVVITISNDRLRTYIISADIFFQIIIAIFGFVCLFEVEVTTFQGYILNANVALAQGCPDECVIDQRPKLILTPYINTQGLCCQDVSSKIHPKSLLFWQVELDHENV